MTPVPQDDLDKIIEVLNNKGAVKPCPRCGKEDFIVADAYFNPTLQDSLQGIILGGPSIPCAVVICSNCGYIMQHALGYLGLLDKK